jgi:VCBS repeat protein
MNARENKACARARWCWAGVLLVSPIVLIGCGAAVAREPDAGGGDAACAAPMACTPDAGSATAESGAQSDGGADVEVDVGSDVKADTANDGACPDPTQCAPDAPRLVSPHSTGIVTSREPVFSFEAAAGATQYKVQLCADAACQTVIETMTTTTTSATATSPLPSGPVFWRVVATNGAGSTPSLTWELFVGRGSALQATSWLGPPDFDRNGHVDAALGSGANAVYVLMNAGGTTGLPSATPSTTLTGGSGFGSATANAGDVNGDGYGDLVVGALDPFNPFAAVLYGGPNGVGNSPILLPVTTGALSVGVGGAGDVNGDGYADVLVSSGRLTSLYLGSAQGPGATPSGHLLAGGSGSGAGDVNADGFADVVVCDPSAQTATVYLGSPTGLGTGTTIPAPANTTGFGDACITAGDVNGDGYADVVVATQGTASAFVFYGCSTGVLTNGPTMLAGGAGSGSGVTTSIAPAGDVNGDGYADVILGAYNTNAVMVYEGGPTGVSTTAATTFSGLPQGQYANSVATVGDADGDGFDDVAFAPSQCEGFPVYVFPGSANGVSTAAAMRTWNAPSGAQCFGIIAR